MIGVVDYGLGNIPAFLRAFNQLNIPVRRVTQPEDFKHVSRMLLPGVGAFDWAMLKLNASGLRDELELQVKDLGKPVLGVCVGLQIFFESSSEGSQQGLGWLKGSVEAIKVSKGRVRLPHMGWNDVNGRGEGVLLQNIASPSFYFLHSYRVVLQDIQLAKGVAHYGTEITAVVESFNIMGTQFHPEKSYKAGLALLKNFSEVTPSA